MMSSNKDPSLPNELSQKIDELIRKLANINLPDKSLLDIFCYYEDKGE
jgi:hypothetical protein